MQTLLERLYARREFAGMKLGLNNILSLDSHFQNPSKKFSSIHIAGTNGKGSVATKIATCLELSGFRVGLFTSPHLISFRERIQINHKMIPEVRLSYFLDQIFATIDTEKIPATFFEITTLLAFLYFSEQKVDIAVLETGLGGRLDATNIVNPLLSIITSLSLEHTHCLGNTLIEIAREKAGIIKENTPTLIGPRIHPSLIKPFCTGPLHIISEKHTSFDMENRSLAKRAIEILHYPVNKGLDALPPCRLQTVHHRNTTLLLDVAHNPDAVGRLLDTIGPGPHHFLFGLCQDKDLIACLKLLKPHTDKMYLINASQERGHSVDHIKKTAISLGFPNNKLICDQTIDFALNTDTQLVCLGSCFLMEKIANALNINSFTET